MKKIFFALTIITGAIPLPMNGMDKKSNDWRNMSDAEYEAVLHRAERA